MAGTVLMPMLVCRMTLARTSHIGSSGDRFARYSHSYFVNLWRYICCLNLMSQPASLSAQATLYNRASGWVSFQCMFGSDTCTVPIVLRRLQQGKSSSYRRDEVQVNLRRSNRGSLHLEREMLPRYAGVLALWRIFSVNAGCPSTVLAMQKLKFPIAQSLW